MSNMKSQELSLLVWIISYGVNTTHTFSANYRKRIIRKRGAGGMVMVWRGGVTEIWHASVCLVVIIRKYLPSISAEHVAPARYTDKRRKCREQKILSAGRGKGGRVGLGTQKGQGEGQTADRKRRRPAHDLYVNGSALSSRISSFAQGGCHCFAYASLFVSLFFSIFLPFRSPLSFLPPGLPLTPSPSLFLSQQPPTPAIPPPSSARQHPVRWAGDKTRESPASDPCQLSPNAADDDKLQNNTGKDVFRSAAHGTPQWHGSPESGPPFCCTV